VLLWLVLLDFTKPLRRSKTFGSCCAVFREEDEAGVDSGLVWKSIECSVFHNYVRGETVIHYAKMI
jgi:hypothetical protein